MWFDFHTSGTLSLLWGTRLQHCASESRRPHQIRYAFQNRSHDDVTDEPVANIGDCILEERRLTESMEKEDVRSVGYMMLELMEADTSLARPKSIQLQRPEDWKNGTGIKEFLAATHETSREQLYRVGDLVVYISPKLIFGSIRFCSENLLEVV